MLSRPPETEHKCSIVFQDSFDFRQASRAAFPVVKSADSKHFAESIGSKGQSGDGPLD